MLSFCLRDDLIVNDKAGFVWLVNFGYTLIKLGGGQGRKAGQRLGKHSVTSNQPQNCLTTVFL